MNDLSVWVELIREPSLIGALGALAILADISFYISCTSKSKNLAEKLVKTFNILVTGISSMVFAAISGTGLLLNLLLPETKT